MKGMTINFQMGSGDIIFQILCHESTRKLKLLGRDIWIILYFYNISNPLHTSQLDLKCEQGIDPFTLCLSLTFFI